MSKPKYLKLLVVVEEDYKAIHGNIEFTDNTWQCENVMTIKLKDDFILPATCALELLEYVGLVLANAKERSDE